MKQVIIISDPAGRPLREESPSTAAEVVRICPHDKPQDGAKPVEFPENWLPSFQPMPYGRRCWWVCDRIYALALQQLQLDGDYFWCAESDVAATPEVWQRLIEAGEKRALDGVYVHLTERHREPDHGWFKHPTTPGWAQRYAFGAIYRLSRRALGWLAASAEANRNVFCEINVTSEVHKQKGSIGDLHQLGWFYSRQSMVGPPAKCMVNTQLLNHPLKSNTSVPVFEMPGFQGGQPISKI